MSRTCSCIRSLGSARSHLARLARLGPLLVAVAVACGSLLSAGTAKAAGQVIIKNPRPEEDEGRWKLGFTFNYGKKPHMAHIPMVFSFKHVTQYIWALTEASGDKPVFQTKRLTNRPEINVPVDVGFADMKGEIHKITKFKIELRRDRDFEAGEYMLTVREGGHTFGRPQRVTLKGTNKPVDRRPIEFKAKPIAGPKKSGPPKSDEPEGDPMVGQDMGDVMVDESEMEGIEDDEPDGPPAEKPKQGGCGCRVPGERPMDSPLGLGLLLAGLGVIALRRLRR